MIWVPSNCGSVTAFLFMFTLKGFVPLYVENGFSRHPFSKMSSTLALQATVSPRPDGEDPPSGGLLGLRGQVMDLVQLPPLLPAIDPATSGFARSSPRQAGAIPPREL